MTTTPLTPATGIDVARLYAVANRARIIYPGPVGEMISREILTWREFGYRFGGSSLIDRLITDVEATPLPKATIHFPEEKAS